MRGDGVAIGDVGAVSCWAWGRRDTSGGHDGRGAWGERDAGVVGGHCRTEQDAASEPCRDRVGVDDGTRVEHGRGGVYSEREGGTHGMRGDGLGVGDVGAVSCWAWRRRNTSGGDDGRGAGWERQPDVVHGHGGTEQDAASESRWHGISVDDSTRIELGGGGIYSAGSDGTHGMRGDGVAIGDVSAVSCGSRGRRYTSGGDDGRGAGGKRDAGLVGGHNRTEQDAASEPCWHRIGVDDSTRIEHGDGCAYSAGEGGAHGMRGYGMAVGDVGAVSCGAWGRRDTSGGFVCRGAGGERVAGVVGGHCRTEQDAASEPGRGRVGVDNGTRIWHGDGCELCLGSDGAHGMRGDGVAVGDVSALSCGERGRRDAAGGDYGGITKRKHEPRVVSRWGYAEPASWVEFCRDKRGVYDPAR